MIKIIQDMRNVAIEKFDKHILVKENIAKERASICDNCEEKNSIGQCKVCKCFLKAKVWAKFSDCPKGKWKY